MLLLLLDSLMWYVASNSLPTNTNAPIWSLSIEIHWKFLLGALLLSYHITSPSFCFYCTVIPPLSTAALKATTGDPTGISSASLTILFHCYKYQYYTITNPWVCSGVVPCACQYGSWKPLPSILGNEQFHLEYCQLPTVFTAHKESGTKYRPFEVYTGRVKHNSNI